MSAAGDRAVAPGPWPGGWPLHVAGGRTGGRTGGPAGGGHGGGHDVASRAVAAGNSVAPSGETAVDAGADAGSGDPGCDLEWEKALELIHAADEVVLACHVVPDGDALGSMLALAQALRSLGKRCLASFGEPFTVPGILRFLPGQDLLVDPGRLPADPRLMISSTSAGRARLGSWRGTPTGPGR
ncbi:DHH family phosphoesterase [Actinomadura sp. CNU-125]|uniref:DHH family phosphoesterase n=1 Tax=Actinomadura sp. CNU-125 TaxID=1904961 RepID=UPI000AE07E8B|nr:hypothetical protein [Actinomadura sp. CNU-125]